MTGLILSVVQMTLVVNVPFCGPNVLDSFYCDLPQLIKLACTDTYQLDFMATASSGFMILLHADHLLYHHHSYCSETLFSWFIQGSVHTLSSHHFGILVLWSFDICLYVAISHHTPG